MPSEMLPYLLCFLMFAIGVYAIIAKKNLIKVIIGVLVIEYSVNLFLLLVGYRVWDRPMATEQGPTRVSYAGEPPILDRATAESNAGPGALLAKRSVDPIPQALVLTSIVIGLSTVALMVALALRLYEKYGTFDVTEMRTLRG